MSETRELSVTIKGEGRDKPWIVFYGRPSEIRDQIVAAFGFDGEVFSSMTLAETTVEANRAFQGLLNVQGKLGGKVLSKGKDEAAETPPAKEPESKESEPETPAEDEGDPLLKAIAEAPDMAAIQTLWKANQKAFKERPDVAEAVKQRREEIGA